MYICGLVSFALRFGVASILVDSFLVLQRLLEVIKGAELPVASDLGLPTRPCPEDTDSDLIRQSWIWERLGRFARTGDVLIADSGTAQFGFSDAYFPEQLNYVTQLYFGSIGYSVGACLGAALAQREIGLLNESGPGRTILVVGDGSLQLTVQEIGTMIRLGLKPIM